MSKRGSRVPSPAYQVSELLKNSFRQGFGRGRHEDKRNAQSEGKHYTHYTKDKIYSGNTYKTIRQKCITVFKFAKSEFKVQYMKDLKPEHFKAFIKKGMSTKQGEPYSKATAESYYSAMCKLQEAYNSQNSTDLNFVDRSFVEHVVVKEKQRERMPATVHDKIIEKAYKADANGKSDNGRAFDIARAAGLRVSEIANLRMKDFQTDKNGNFKDINRVMNLNVFRSKGGKTTLKPLSKFTPEQVEKIQSIYNHFKEKGLGPMDKLFPNRETSYSQAFARYREQVAPGEYKQCGVHSMRKEWAKAYYDREITIRPEQEVIRDLTCLLNHFDTHTTYGYINA